VSSPLVEACVVEAALRLRREELLPLDVGDHPKRLLRHSALAWLPAAIAMHPKIGGADGQLLRRMRLEEHHALLELLGSETARRAGFALPASAEVRDAPLWRGDRWMRAAALVAWFDRHPVSPAADRRAASVTRVGVASSVEAAPPPARGRRSTPHVVIVAALNIAAQLVPHRRGRPARGRSSHGTARDAEALRAVLTDLARRACRMPPVTGSSRAMHRALHWYLMFFRQPATLVRGVRQGETELRYWIEIGGVDIDVNGSELPLVPCADR
jgi:hypothetical protein